MRLYKELPEEKEFVVIRIEKIYENSVLAFLEGYNKHGLIHISEIARSWVKDLRLHVRVGEKTVAQVLRIDEKGNIDLSLKRVNERAKREKLAQWEKEIRADKFLDVLAKKLNKSKGELYEEVGFQLQKYFGSMYAGFEAALFNPERIEKILGKEYSKYIIEIAKENINVREVKMSGTMKIYVPDPRGIEIIKRALAIEDENVSIKYLSAPMYQIDAFGINQEECRNRIRHTIEKIRSSIENSGGYFEFRRK